MGNKPGIMIYFDVAEALKSLSYEDKGRLLEAMLEYGQYGVVPEFEGALSMAWSFMRPKLDRDAEEYKKKVMRNTHKSYIAKMKRENKDALDYEDWLAERNLQEPVDTRGYQRVPVGTSGNPTTTTPTTPAGATTTPTTPAGATTSETTSAGDTKAEGAGKGTGEPVHGLSFDEKRRKNMDLLRGYEQ